MSVYLFTIKPARTISLERGGYEVLNRKNNTQKKITEQATTNGSMELNKN